MAYVHCPSLEDKYEAVSNKSGKKGYVEERKAMKKGVGKLDPRRRTNPISEVQ